MTARDDFLAGDRPDDIALYIADDLITGDIDTLTEHGDRVDGGVLLVVAGDEGRALVPEIVGVDAMAFAREAMGTDAEIGGTLSTGTCPEAEHEDHDPVFVLSFVEPRHEDVAGPYAEGPVLHAYAACECGVTYSDRWPIPE